MTGNSKFKNTICEKLGKFEYELDIRWNYIITLNILKCENDTIFA